MDGSRRKALGRFVPLLLAVAAVAVGAAAAHAAEWSQPGWWGEPTSIIQSHGGDCSPQTLSGSYWNVSSSRCTYGDWSTPGSNADRGFCNGEKSDTHVSYTCIMQSAATQMMCERGESSASGQAHGGQWWSDAHARNFGGLQECLSYRANASPPPPGPSVNRPPVARPEMWSVRAGMTVDGNLLANDTDPDGDPITVRVLSISFAAREWSGADTDGSFLYTSGSGTIKKLVKRVTYVVADNRGGESAPVVAQITVVPPKRTADPRRRDDARTAVAAAVTRGWDGGWEWGSLCFGSGVKTNCYYMLSTARTREFNRALSWRIDPSSAITVCLKFGLVPLKNTDCAKKILSTTFGALVNRSVISNAAKWGDCLLYRVSRRRTLSHPRAGEWGKPKYDPYDSPTKAWNGNGRFSGYGEWDGKRIPLFCHSDGLAYRYLGQLPWDDGF